MSSRHETGPAAKTGTPRPEGSGPGAAARPVRPGHRGPGGGGPMALMKGEKAKDFGGTIKRLVLYMAGYKAAIAAVFVFAAVSSVFSIIGPKVLGKATTELFTGLMQTFRGTGGIDFAAIGNILLFVLGLYIVSTVFNGIMSWVMARVSTDIAYRFRRDISRKINTIPLRYFDRTTHGEVLSRITNDVDVINQTLSQSLTQIISSIVTVIGVLVMMISINWLLTLTALVMLPLTMGFVQFIVKHSQKYFRQQQEYLGHVNGHIEEMFGNHVVMKVFNGEEKSIAKFRKLNTRLYESAWKSQFLTGLIMPMIGFIGNLGYVAVTILGGWLTFRQAMTIGDIQAFLQYVRHFTQPITQIGNISNILQQTAAAAERVFAFLDEEQEIEETETPVFPDEVKGHVEFRDIRFSYISGEPVIRNFSAAAAPGQKIAIVGPTGAGKTTMVKLLMRFYDIDAGDIFIDGQEIKDFTRNDLRENFAMVLQDTWLFNGTVMENIRYGREDAADAEIYAAAKAAHADHFIHTLPDGYNMVINEETSNISQGQKQLLTIARAILADPRILILDEATSSVDTRTEILIQKAMDNLMKGRTSFIIAHRLSTIRNADLILVMNEGDIIEQGTHAELLAMNGFYADLYNSQFVDVSK